jgi:hypothetical protein
MSDELLLKRCPFCGKAPDPSDQDTLHPSGIFWHFDGDIGMAVYVTAVQRQEGDSPCYVMNCVKLAGGCGAEINGDSKDEVVAAWNRRADAVVQSDADQPADLEMVDEDQTCPYCSDYSHVGPEGCPQVSAIEYHEGGWIKRVELTAPEEEELTFSDILGFLFLLAFCIWIVAS